MGAKLKSAETRARILDAALALFRKRGFEQTTMREIAAEAGMAVGAAYYYFESKEALVMEFYNNAQKAMEPGIVDGLARRKGLEARLRSLIEAKFQHFEPNRRLLGALSAHTDPEHPLSPFSEATREIREKDIGFFAQAMNAPGVRIPEDLRSYLPRLLWLYQMGLILFWVYDSSPGQSKTERLVTKTLKIVTSLIKFSNFPLMSPIRGVVRDLLVEIYSECAS
jgi:AcrR family transcriptional regulator